MHPRFAKFLPALLALGFAAPSFAQPAPPPAPPAPPMPPPFMSELDTNGDGAITREEFAAGDVFAKLDRNSDGQIDSQDFSRTLIRHQMHQGMLLQLADEDGDQNVTQADWLAFLAKADADGNGKLERNEIHALMPAPPAPPKAPEAPEAPAPPDAWGRGFAPPPGGPGFGGPGFGGPGFGGPGFGEPGFGGHSRGFGPPGRGEFRGGPGKGREENPAPSLEDLEKTFESLDKNQDGKVSGDEWPKMLDHFRRAHAAPKARAN